MAISQRSVVPSNSDGWQVMWRTPNSAAVGRCALMVHSRAHSTAAGARRGALQIVSMAFQGEVRIVHVSSGMAEAAIASVRELSMWHADCRALPSGIDGLWSAEEARRTAALDCYKRIAAALGEAMAAGLLTRKLGRELRRAIVEYLEID